MVNTILTGLVAALSVVATAIPTDKGKTPPKKQPVCKNPTYRNANFDDLGGIPGTITNPIPSPYMGLAFTGFQFANIVSSGLGVQPGVVPHSPPNYAVADVQSQLQGTPMLTTNFPNSKTASFDLDSFYFGCATQLGNGAAALPAACNVQVTGYQGSDNSISNARQVCSQQFQFNPTTSLGPVNQAFSGKVSQKCKNLQFAIVTFSPPGGAAATSPLLLLNLDDIKYKTCSK